MNKLIVKKLCVVVLTIACCINTPANWHSQANVIAKEQQQAEDKRPKTVIFQGKSSKQVEAKRRELLNHARKMLAGKNSNFDFDFDLLWQSPKKLKAKLDALKTEVPELRLNNFEYRQFLNDVEIADTLSLPENVTLTGDTVIWVNSLHFMGENVEIRGNFNLSIFVNSVAYKGNDGKSTQKGRLSINLSGKGSQAATENKIGYFPTPSNHNSRQVLTPSYTGFTNSYKNYIYGWQAFGASNFFASASLFAARPIVQLKGSDGQNGSEGTGGSDGQSGIDGTPGSDGVCFSGPDGANGSPGNPGNPGSHGGNGGSGSDGQNGGTFMLWVGDPSGGSCPDIEESTIDVSGGKGGNGGSGGKGGNGGSGGDGGNGGNGADFCCSNGMCCTPGTGPGNGGNGGNGASGGIGGNGGNGGDGGDGGDGGSVMISVPNCVTTSFNINVSGGDRGNRGNGGDGGSDGSAGSGGTGGRGGSSVGGFCDGSGGSNGSPGTPNGLGGFPGYPGTDGWPGNDGSAYIDRREY